MVARQPSAGERQRHARRAGAPTAGCLGQTWQADEKEEESIKESTNSHTAPSDGNDVTVELNDDGKIVNIDFHTCSPTNALPTSHVMGTRIKWLRATAHNSPVTLHTNSNSGAFNAYRKCSSGNAASPKWAASAVATSVVAICFRSLEVSARAACNSPGRSRVARGRRGHPSIGRGQ